MRERQVYSERETGTQIDRQVYRESVRETNRYTERQTGIKRDRHLSYRETGSYTVRQA